MAEYVWMRRDYYDLLEIDRDASAQEIKAARRKQLAAWHPDRYGANLASTLKGELDARVARIGEAAAILSDPDSRELYDLTLPEPPQLTAMFDEALQNVPSVWKALSHWMAQEDVGTGFQRRMAYRAGDYLERSRTPSDKERVHMLAAWELAVDEGFDVAEALAHG